MFEFTRYDDCEKLMCVNQQESWESGNFRKNNKPFKHFVESHNEVFVFNKIRKNQITSIKRTHLQCIHVNH